MCQHLNIPLVFLKFYQEENSVMAYTRKCSVYLKCLYEHTKANNYCYKPRQQLLVACLSHFVQFLGSFVPALPVFCSFWIPVQVKSLFPCPHYLLGSAAFAFPFMGTLGWSFVTHLLLEPCLMIPVGPSQLRIFWNILNTVTNLELKGSSLITWPWDWTLEEITTKSFQNSLKLLTEVFEFILALTVLLWQMHQLWQIWA